MNRVKYLELAQKRAIDELNQNGITSAYRIMRHYLSCHPATADSVMLRIFENLYCAGKLSSQVKMKRFIKGFRFKNKN